MSVVIEVILAIVLLTIIYIRVSKKDYKMGFIYSYIVLMTLLSVVILTIVFTTPNIKLNGALRVEVMSGDKVKAPKTFYMGLDVTNKVKLKGNVNYHKIGSYKVILEVPMILENYHKKVVVEVVDTIPPEIYLEGGENVELSYSKEYQELGARATDRYDGDLTEKIIQKRKVVRDDKFDIEYTVTDQSGNTSKAVRHITLIDEVAPVITLNGEDTVTLIKGNSYSEQGATAFDEKDGDLTAQINIEGSVDSDHVGTYYIHYTVSDTKGNSSSVERSVRVVEYPSGSTIYLTFDDGPCFYTSKLLDILKKYDVKATFFVTNQGLTQGYDDVIKRAYDEGHTIGLHTYSHVYDTIYASEEAYFQDLAAIQKKVKDITGHESKIIRFPGGSSNMISRFNPGIMSRLSQEVEAKGYRYFDWNVSSGDAGGAYSSEQVFNNVVNSLKGGPTYVVLQHDIKEFSVDAVENIILYALQNGYTFQALDMNSPTVHHGINN